MRIESKKNIAVEVQPSGAISVWAGTQLWNTQHDFVPSIKIYNKTINKIEEYHWSDCAKVRQEVFATGYSQGIRTYYEGFPFCESFSFATFVEILEPEGKLRVGIIPVQDSFSELRSMNWPGPMDFSEIRKDHYTVYPMMQGILIPNGWKKAIDISERGDLNPTMPCSRSAIMPWFGQVRQNKGYWYLLNTPFDGGFSLKHEAGGDCTVGTVWHSQLGQIGYKREATYTFYEKCDYNTFCKAFRGYLKEVGELCTLREKIAKNPAVEKLIGTCIYHDRIYTNRHPGTFYYKENGQNQFVVTFEEMGNRIAAMKARGIEKMYIHTDGWGNEGYDNRHPDVLPPCPKAGGWEGFKALCEKVKSCGFQFGIHDQYDDYYLDAPSYSREWCIQNYNGTYSMCKCWEGGPQEYLCTEFITDYLKRNYLELKENGINLDGTYLDCFSAVPPKECYDPLHRMTREQCIKYRSKGFEYIRSLGLIISSEEAIGWAVQHMDLVHHQPYAFETVLDPVIKRLKNLDGCLGFPVPLVNLVFHDCVVMPWRAIEKKIDYQDGFLHTLLNGGVPYASLDFSDEEIEKVKVMAKWHEKVGLSEMLSHEVLSDDGMVQRSRFANGAEITVDFANNTYEMKEN